MHVSNLWRFKLYSLNHRMPLLWLVACPANQTAEFCFQGLMAFLEKRTGALTHLWLPHVALPRVAAGLNTLAMGGNLYRWAL